ncbi:MAG: putative toxin-antitoxin system toxin component, PIN family [Candidatus Saccharimonadales bacterium]
MKPVRVVLDTNVYVAAALNPQSIIYKIVEDSAAQYLGTYYTSPEILQELQDKLENKFEFPRDTVVRWLSRIEEAVTVIRPRQKVDLLTERDPDDNKILECALEAKADLIITADPDLLHLKEFHNTKIMHTSSVKYLFPHLEDK